MNRFSKIIVFIVASAIFTSCKKDKDPVFIIQPSDGSSLQLDGLAGTEPGSSAGNSVFIDFSANKQTAVARKSWDLGFYCGTEFRVILNNTSATTAKGLAKNDLTLVGTADTIALNKLAMSFDISSNLLVDNVHNDLTKTVIAAVSAVDAENKVYIINPGIAGGLPARDWYKIRILKTVDGYRLQYATLQSVTFKTIDISKDADYSFRYFSFDNGIVNAEPIKNQWDIKWSYQLYETSLGTDLLTYPFSDFITINSRAGVQAAEVLNTTVTYDNFSATNVAGVTFSGAVDAIAGKWRSTNPATGVRTDRFYVIKDPIGNIYKVKFLAMGVNDGGTRGKPQLQYKLVP